MRKTKIVCTIGPASDSVEMLRKLMKNGMNVARLNFSHGTHESHQKTIDNFKKAREMVGVPCALLLDTKGPEIRLKEFANGKEELTKGQLFTLTTNDVLGDNNICSITYKGLVNDVEVGGRILIDDGLIEMKVLKITDTDIECEVINGGKVSNKKGVNVPGANLSMPFISEVDRNDIIFLEKLPLFNEKQHKGGLIIEKRETRQYPYGDLAGRVIGYVKHNSDTNTRHIGIEGKYDYILHGKKGAEWKKITDKNALIKDVDSSIVAVEHGYDIRLESKIL